MSDSMEITNKEEIIDRMQKNLNQKNEESVSKPTNVGLIDKETKRRWLTPLIIPQN